MEDKSPVFLTGRFRSGTTALWRVFEEHPGFQAYYEPLHDGLLGHIAFTSPSKGHRGVESYWGAYHNILPDLHSSYRRDFGTDRLLLEADQQHDELESYLRMLIDRSQPLRPVLQFNRVDFRLPWLRRKFPEATIVHLVRNPRDTWVSSRRHLKTAAWDDALEVDAFDLLQWTMSLADEFPFLADPANSAYVRHYQLARLSELMGERCADVTLSFEADLLGAGVPAGSKLVEAGVLSAADLPNVESVIDHDQGESWSKIRPAGWFEAQEAQAEAQLDGLGLRAQFGYEPLSQIRATFADEWGRLALDENHLRQTLLLKLSECRSEQTRLLHEIDQLDARLPKSEDESERRKN